MALNPEEIRRVMSALGKRGGSKKSKKKTLAARKNAKRPRKRKSADCSNCGVPLTSADYEGNACTQCSEPIKEKQNVKP